ncbi:hypothetical protein [Streptomyces olindensis]|uniref:hypothetical protein n=1 Tax=Streptomyces olindensis TaxID=358823 RepID=UPI0034061686
MSESRNPDHDFGAVYVEAYVGVGTGHFVRRATADRQGVLVKGACPRCLGDTASEYRYGLPGTGTKGLLDRLRGAHPAPTGTEAIPDGAEVLLREVHFCECGHPHPGLPADAPFVGCGASWRVAALHAEDTV